jgi:hypothetical protein
MAYHSQITPELLQHHELAQIEFHLRVNMGNGKVGRPRKPT